MQIPLFRSRIPATHVYSAVSDGLSVDEDGCKHGVQSYQHLAYPAITEVLRCFRLEKAGEAEHSHCQLGFLCCKRDKVFLLFEHRRSKTKAHRPASFAGRREVVGYENPREGFASQGAAGGRVELVASVEERQRPTSRRGVFGPRAPPN
jgi:hypothetical protein